MNSQQIERPVEHLYSELRELRTRTAEKRVKISLLRERIDKAMAERDALNAEVKRISAEVRKLKSNRDSLNAKVKELKTKRDELRNEAAKKREMLTQLLEQAREISEQLHGSMSDVLAQIKRLEWFIQTNPLAPQAERNLVAKIGALETNLAKHKGLQNVRDRLLQLKIDVGALRIRAQSTHEELTKIAEESEKVHESMKESLKLLAAARKKADQKHTECVAHIEERREAINALKSNLVQMDEIRARIRDCVPSEAEKAEKVKSKYKEAANEKIRTGRKLSFEEFQALMGDSPAEAEDE
jgi:uncharacterized coiled-coil DUF342 family protein